MSGVTHGLLMTLGGESDPDPNFSSVSALLHCDGSNASTTITDSSGKNISWTAYGNAQLTTAQYKFGTASVTFDGYGDYIMPASSSHFSFGTGDFTIELFARFASTANAPCLFDWRPFGGTPLAPAVFLSLASSLKLSYYMGQSVAFTGSTSIQQNQWYHIAVSRASGATRMFLDGTQEGSYTDNNNYAQTQPTFGALGYDPSLSTYAFNGQLDEIRITKGVARYTANFTAPTKAFPDK